MKIVIAMDSFKGSMSSLEAGNTAKEGILSLFPEADIEVLPLADGGEGTIDELMPYIGASRKELIVTGPLGEPLNSYYIFSKNKAYIEMAKASGLTLVNKLDPLHATTYGTGELIKDALQNGFEELIICLGGSATNDAGAGMLQALGMKLLDKDGQDIKSGAIGLRDLYSSDTSTMVDINSKITVASDVINPLCGPSGASYVYGPQKGASDSDVKELDELLKGFAEYFDMDPYEEGTGAAGGMSFAIKNFMNGRIVSGADLFISEINLEDKIKDADIVITGEGRMDGQTVNGKGPMKVADLAIKHSKKIYAITGQLGDGYEKCLEMGIMSIEKFKDKSMEKTAAMNNMRNAAASLSRQIADTI